MSKFTDLVQSHYDYLVTDHGFKCEVESERRVVYRSDSSVLQVGFGERGDIGMNFDRTTPTWHYPFSFYLRVFYPDEEAKLGECVAHSTLEMEIQIVKLANLLKQVGQPIIRGDQRMFQELSRKASGSLGL